MFRNRVGIALLAVIAVFLASLVAGVAAVPSPAAAASGGGVTGSVLGINDTPEAMWDDPLPGVRVAVFDAATGALVKAADTNSLGRYAITDLPAKPLKLRFTKTGWLTTWRPGTVTPPGGGAADLGEQTIYAEVVVTGGVLSWMDPIGGARVTVFDAATGAVLAAQQLGELETDYRVGQLPAGSIKVRATKPGYITAWAGPYTVVAGEVLAQSWDPAILYLDMAPAVVVQGRVTGVNQAQGWTGPLAGVRVLMTDAATGAAVAAVTTDAAGQYRFKALAPGRNVKVRFTKSGWLTQTHPADVDLLPYGNPVDLGSVTMPAAAAISGQVLSNMDPIDGARVTVFNAATGVVITAINADTSGYYRVGGLPAGPVKVRATKTGYRDAWANSPAATFAQAKTYTLVSGQQLAQTWSPTLDLYIDLTPR